MSARGRRRDPNRQPPPAWATRLVRARQDAGLTQEALGEIIGRGQGSITEYERGDTRPDSTLYEAIAAACGVAPGWLAFGDPADSNPLTGSAIERYKDDRRFASAFHQAARMHAEERLEADFSYLVAYTIKLLEQTKSIRDDAEAQEIIRAAIEADRKEIRAGLDHIREKRLSR